MVAANLGVQVPPAGSSGGYAGVEKCAECHVEIAESYLKSDHAHTLRKITALPALLRSLPMEFADTTEQVKYRLERSFSEGISMDLVATKGAQSARLSLLWAFGAGRKGITFVGRAGQDYIQSRVSWYQRIQGLDVTTGAEVRRVKDAHEALGDVLSPQVREGCFACHMTRNAELLPEKIDESVSGVQCERCHGPGAEHIRFITEGKGSGIAIQNPGKLAAKEQLHFCGVCHRQASEEFSKVILDKSTIRFPAQRLVLSRCYDESDGRLKCTTCHNPHENLPESMAAYDPKCLSCHAGEKPIGSPCPVSRKDCVSCHMPREPLMRHSDFADHWIRRVRRPAP